MPASLRTLSILLLLSTGLRGETPATDSKTVSDLATDDIARNLDEQRSLVKLFDRGLLPDRVHAWRQKKDAFLEDHGLNFALAYDSLLMGALGGGDNLFAGSGELSLTGHWTMLGERRGSPLDLYFRLRSRNAYADRAPAELANDMGALWGPTDGFSDNGFEIPDFYFKQRFARIGLELRVGQLSVDAQLDKHALRSAKQAFVNRAFSSNPAVAFPRFGAGATVHWAHASGFDVTAAATTVQATKAGDQVDFDFSSSDLFKAVQFGYDFSRRGGDPARVQVMVWNSDSIDEEDLPGGSGTALTVEQELSGADARLFLRYAWSHDKASALSHLVAGGFGKTCREVDLFGVALGAGQSSGSDDNWQMVFEAFYRWQAARDFHLTPDVQILAGNGFSGSGAPRIVLGLRGHVDF